MENDKDFYRRILDPRGYEDEYPNPIDWRKFLREYLYKKRNKGLSDLTKRYMPSAFEAHEAVFSRKYVPKSGWQVDLFAGPNVILLLNAEHIPYPPSRELGFWVGVMNYSMEDMVRWVDSLPFKSTVSKPWKETHGLTIVDKIPIRHRVSSEWHRWVEANKGKLDCYG